MLLVLFAASGADVFDGLAAAANSGSSVIDQFATEVLHRDWALSTERTEDPYILARNRK